MYDQLDEGQQASFEEAWRIFYEHHLQVAHHYYDAGISVAQIVAVPQKEKEKRKRKMDKNERERVEGERDKVIERGERKRQSDREGREKETK